MRRVLVSLVLIVLVLGVVGCGGYNFTWGEFSDLFAYSSLDSAKWTTAKGAPRISDGWLILPGTPGNGADVQSIESFAVGNKLAARVRATQWAVDTSIGFESWIDDNGVPRHCAIVLTNDHLGIINQFVADNPATPEKENEWYASIDPPLVHGQAYDVQIGWWLQQVTLIVNGETRAEYRAADHPGANLIPNQLLRVRLNGSNDYADELAVDYITVGLL